MQVPRLPKVSVVIPTYNRARAIRPTLKSVLDQSIKDIEVLIIDDHSTDYDELVEVVKELNDSRIILLRHEENRHGSAARNTGINHAKGEYIALLDSDDVWVSDKLEACLAVEINDNDVLYSQLINKDGSFPQKAIASEEDVADYLFLNNGSMQTSTLFLSATLAKKVLFDESLVRFQDYDFVIRLQRAGANFKFIHRVLVEMKDVGDGNRISNNINYEPAVFWLNKINHKISKNACEAFYFKRVVRLMVISGEQSKIFFYMPKIVKENLNFLTTLKYRLMSLTPSFVFKFIRLIWKLIKK